MMIHLSREGTITIFICYQFFKQLQKNRLVGNPYSQMVLIDIMTPVDGQD